MRIEKVNLTKENLELIKNIDKTFYNEDILTLEWYLERYTKEQFGYLLFDNNNCVGYLVAVPIRKELYDAIINAVMTNDLYFNPEMFVNSSDYYYISSSVILSDYRKKGYGTKLFNYLLSDLKDKYLCAITVSENGINLVKNKMNLIKKMGDFNCIYNIKV